MLIYVFFIAHKSDIYGVATTKKYTATCSGDGAVILWDNASTDSEPIVALSSPVGFHHVTTDKKDVLAAISFDGKVHLFNLDTLAPIDTSGMIFPNFLF